MPSHRLALEFVRLETDPEDPLGMQCPSCHDLLTIHQPDVERPDLLLGICPECRGWFLIDATAGVMSRLPDRGAHRNHRRPPSPGASRSVGPGP
jgi:hypothetical protein